MKASLLPGQEAARGDGVHPEKDMKRYAWLEHEGGTWHFLTSPLAVTGESIRRWSSGRIAILELVEEGWSIVRPYPGVPSVDSDEEVVYGYGLTRTIH